jgi:serine phosphatase RsbU (regulator of sigma subunit)
MILLVILLNVLSVMAFVIYQRRRTEAFQASLKQEIRDLRVIEEGYYFYENFSRIQQILADPAIEVEEAMRRVMKVLTDMGEYQLLQKGAFFLTNPDRESLRMLVQYNADNLLATCQVVYKGQCLCGRVLATGNSINKSCVDHEHEIIPSGMQPHGHYVLPIQWQNDTLGVFTLYVADGAPYSQRTQNFLQMVADAIAKRLMIQRQKAQLQDQLEEIQSGHRAAARLMQAILPTPSLLTALFNGDSAILYAPAQALGGDFYFFHEKGAYIYFGVGDAEGHGVPGALLAVMLMQGIQEILEKRPYARPAEVLLSLHQSLVRSYQGAEALHRNGADLALCRYNKQTGELRYVGARIPLLYSHNGKLELVEPVPAALGTDQMEHAEIIDGSIDLKPSTRLYLMSDGLPSQLSGDTLTTIQKFGRRRLYEILEQTSELPMAQQMARVQAALADWQRGAEQTDDITLWALRPEALRTAPQT